MKHNAHLVSNSVYPFFMGLASLSLTSSMLVYMKLGALSGVLFSVLFFFVIIMLWYKDVLLEGLAGYHNYGVVEGFKLGFLIFVLTEVMFFFSIFWFFFDVFWLEGFCWMPGGYGWVEYWLLPFLGTLLLLSSSVSGTWAHNCILSNKSASQGVGITIVLGVMFLFVQGYEYSCIDYNLGSGVSSSIFFFGTGFHGFHVFLGSLILFLCFLRSINGMFNMDNHFMLEGGLIYWHFVDVVWLFLYLTFYNSFIYMGYN